MSKTPKNASTEERGQADQHSVYDFLFQDVRRVGSLLAQFEPSGHLQSVTETDSIESAYAENSKLKGGGGAFAFKAQAESGDEFTSGNSRSAKRAYDPLWVNAINLLTYLQRRDLLETDIAKARLGQIILVRGQLSVFDMGTLQRIWADPATLKKLIPQIDKTTKPAAIDKHIGTLKFLSLLPHPVQMTLQTNEGVVWAILPDGCLEIAASNLFLKYGTRVAGEWYVLGILDALPEEAASDPETGDVNTLIDMMKKFSVVGRHLGRPEAAYGATPLLIFRRIS